MRAGFTGTRNGMTWKQKATFAVYLREHPDITEFHHGDCVGSDEDSTQLLPYDIYTIAHPPEKTARRAYTTNDETRPPRDYLDRNHDIVDDTDILIATPAAPETVRSGTWATIRYARTTGKPVVIINPDGSITMETPCHPAGHGSAPTPTTPKTLFSTSSE